MKCENEWKFIFEIVIAFFYTCLFPFTCMLFIIEEKRNYKYRRKSLGKTSTFLL